MPENMFAAILYLCFFAQSARLMAQSFVGTFAGVLPMIIVMLVIVVLLSLINARRAAKRIVAPINTLNLEKPLENEAYDELAPLLTRMDKQHSQINKHVKELQTARSELAAIMDNMREGMILLDSKDHIPALLLVTI